MKLPHYCNSDVTNIIYVDIFRAHSYSLHPMPIQDSANTSSTVFNMRNYVLLMQLFKLFLLADNEVNVYSISFISALL